VDNLETLVSKRGDAVKFCFGLKDGLKIESVLLNLLPEKWRLCLSTQAGCPVRCPFCATGRKGLKRNLSPDEITDQFLAAAHYLRATRSHKISSVIFMGMGEPLANTENLLKSLEILTAGYAYGLSPSRITVSTIGILPGLEKVMAESKCHLAISLHSPFPEERLELMPVEKLYPIRRILEFLKKNPSGRQRRISFEYIMFSGINDTTRHINGLTRLLNGLRCRINLIRYHPIPGVSLVSSDDDTVQWFRTRLNEKGILTTVRASRGQDIFAACGMLSTLQRSSV